MDEAPETDAIIIGAGPAGLFAAFQLGLYGLRCLLIDALDQPGGQCRALYADKPVYDVPGLARIEAGALVEQMLTQIQPFSPRFLFGQKVVSIRKDGPQVSIVTTSGGDTLRGKVVVIAAGGGAFRAGAAEQDGFALDPVPFQSWGLEAVDGATPVDGATMATVIPGIFAIGDACRYAGKLKLILSGCHEAALMGQAIRKMMKPDGRAPLYTSASATLRRRLGVKE